MGVSHGSLPARGQLAGVTREYEATDLTEYATGISIEQGREEEGHHEQISIAPLFLSLLLRLQCVCASAIENSCTYLTATAGNTIHSLQTPDGKNVLFFHFDYVMQHENVSLCSSPVTAETATHFQPLRPADCV